MIRYILQDKRFILILFIINLVGTIYGYYWYGWQLEITPPIFIPFVPDSPTASLFFTVFLLFFLFRKNIPFIEALAIVSLFKYGIWAVVMNLLTLYVDEYLHPSGYMLMASHLGMAIQGLLYAPFYKIKLKHIVLASIVVLHNDIIDYVFGHMPMYGSLSSYTNEIGYFTFWLSILSIGISYWLTIHQRERN
ncbi:DUF1405 domain-containing protein [Oceanobacillus iheyensis]|uniref:Hypothetical conserved protein n=1 Tax=Oceanobacillus iheyensis (strain DSM 14371 / CIP 107618 / JCM 11309 / KCTC 3954 / HTE831) TaxID=221109 RepID=Q8EQC8_OCEIH|nr:DUF1405 domain-containing protein [Oceanobacillus iheyensis]BAC13729.1 hypothetical conserved protein [Oceanobacillus iheyensis HTE831]